MNNSEEINIAIPLTKSISKILYLFIKRLFDIFSSMIGIIILIPIAIIVKISYIISGDFNSIFYSHERIGKNGKIFKLYKFRSMVPNADQVLVELLKDKKYKEEWDKDPRITKMGNILRKTSLDEMPQFINVLIGDMSLIGPRPLVKGELDKHKGNHEIYEKMRPGITGWWACNGRSATDYKERLNLEYYYINNCSLILDIKCILLTIKAVIYRTGAK